MKLFTKKNLIQKMTIVLVILMLFNFIMPNFVRAETAIETAGKVIFTPVRGFLVMCGDGLMTGLQYLLKTNEKAVIPYSDQIEESKQFIGEEDDRNYFEYYLGDIVLDVYGNATGQDKPNFKYTPKFIFENKIKSFDINFISPSRANTNGEAKENENSEENQSSYSDETWYEDYVYTVEKCQEKYNTSTDETEKGVARTVLRRLGAWDDTTNNVGYTDETAKNAVSELSQRYYNGATMYEMLGADPTSKDATMKKYVEFLDSGIGTYVIGTVAEYHKVAGNETKETLDYDAIAPVNALHDMIATWYKILRNIALIFLLSILVYIGIRIILSSTAADNAKYKKMLVDWVVALCILFALHYIMAGINGAVNMVVDAFTPSNSSDTDAIFGNVRTQLMSENLSDQLFYTVLYLVLVIYTLVFTFYYLKRVVYAAFLTLIAPLVALTYPLDRMGDGKSQAFNMWLKEYIANVIIQPVHLLIYTVLIGSVLSLSVKNPLYAIVVMGAMMPAEKFIREMFGLNSQKGLSPAGSFAGGALAASAMNKLLSKPPRMHPRGEHGKSKDNGSENENETKRNKIKMKDSMSDIANSIVGQDVPDVNNGDFTDSRELDNQEQAKNEDIYLPNNKDTSNMDEIASPSQEEIDAALNPPMDDDRVTMDEIAPPSQEEINATLNSPMDKNTSTMDEIAPPPQEEIDATLNPPMHNNRQINSQEDKLQQGNNNLNMPNKATIPMSKAEQKQAKKTLKKQKRAAQYAASKRYYTKLTKQRLRKLGKLGKGLARGALKTAGAATGIALGATAGIVGGIATGDVGNALKFTGAGALAGAKFGSVIGDDVYNIGARGGSGVASAINSQKEMKQMWQNDLYNTNEEYRKKVDQKEAKKLIKSAETTAMIQQRFGRGKVKEAQKAMMEYNERGIDNVDTMLNCFGLEQGIDRHGNRFTEPGSIDRNQAIMAGRIAEQYDVNNASGRKSSKDELEHQLANSVYNGSFDGKEYTITRDQAFDRVKGNVNNIMKLADMAQGIDTKHAGLADQLEESNKAKQKRTRAKEVRERMEVENEVARENNNKNN